MNIEKKILILAVIVIFSAILYNLMKARSILKASIESFSIMGSASSELSAMTVSDTVPGIVSMEFGGSIDNLPIREFCVKSSFNSACTGSYVDARAINYVLSRGCRFLDFEVYNINNILCVGVSTNPITGKQNVTSKNTISLDTALRQVIVSGFSSPSPNASDPIFVRIRLQVSGEDAISSEVYKNIASIINSTLNNRLYDKLVTSETPLRDLMGKIVLVWDNKISPEYVIAPKLVALVNIDSDSDLMRTFTNKLLSAQSLTPPHINDDSLTSDVYIMRNVSPDNTNESSINPINATLISEHGAQYVCNRFYIPDANLVSYEKFFRDNKRAFVPFSQAIPYTTISL